MTHPYNDLDTLISDVYSDALGTAEDEVFAWIDRLIAGSVPKGWKDQTEAIQVTVTPVAFLEALIERIKRPVSPEKQG